MHSSAPHCVTTKTAATWASLSLRAGVERGNGEERKSDALHPIPGAPEFPPFPLFPFEACHTGHVIKSGEMRGYRSLPHTQGTLLSRSLEPGISYKHNNNLGNYILDRHEPSRPDKGGQPDCQGWLTSYKITTCQALIVQDAQLVTTLQVLIYLSFFLYSCCYYYFGNSRSQLPS